MKILVDENIPRVTVGALREQGHDVRDVRGSSGQGMSDSNLWSVAVSERRLLVTTDKAFTGFRSVPHFGILIVRLRQPNRTKIHAHVMLALRMFSATDWSCQLVVMRDYTVSRSRAQ